MSKVIQMSPQRLQIEACIARAHQALYRAAKLAEPDNNLRYTCEDLYMLVDALGGIQEALLKANRPARQGIQLRMPTQV